MSLKPQAIEEVPEETRRVAEAAFPKGNRYMRMRDELGTFYHDEDFEDLFPQQGQHAYSPWRLALISVMQFAENLSDRQAADAVRGRIDWKYALSLELTDCGFDHSVLSEFRDRLVGGGKERELLDKMLEVFREQGLLKTRGKQRTDSTHVLASVRSLSRIETVGETLRAALNSLAAVAEDWLVEIAPKEWYERYEKRFEGDRLPKSKEEHKQLGETIGQDGMLLLESIDAENTLDWLSKIPAVETLRWVWIHQYVSVDGKLRMREANELPPSSIRYESPYDPEAHYSEKGSTRWTGYKVHMTENCDDDAPHVICHVETTIASQPDVSTTESIHESLAEKELLPEEHLVDGGYVDAQLLVSSQKEYDIELVGPVRSTKHWQAKKETGYAIDDFEINWQEKSVRCPAGQTARDWRPHLDPNGTPVIRVRFRRSVCGACEVRSLCTRAVKDGRCLSLRGSQAEHEKHREVKHQQETPQWRKRYAKRAGVEGTISQGVRSFGLRQARYVGLAKTHLQNVLTAAAINIVRVDDWLTGKPLARTRVSRFTRIQPQAA
jgi:transposase